MNIEELAKFLSKEMGKCWHEINSHQGRSLLFCTKCRRSSVSNPDPLSWEFFGEVWNWATKQDWWCHFFWQKLHFKDGYGGLFLDQDMIGPKLIVVLAEWIWDKNKGC